MCNSDIASKMSEWNMKITDFLTIVTWNFCGKLTWKPEILQFFRLKHVLKISLIYLSIYKLEQTTRTIKNELIFFALFFGDSMNRILGDVMEIVDWFLHFKKLSSKIFEYSILWVQYNLIKINLVKNLKLYRISNVFSSLFQRLK